MAASAFRTARIELPKTAFFLCDMQERFKTAIANFDLITTTCARMLKAAKILHVPVFTTEQNPKALGATVSPLSDLLKELPELSSTAVHPKTKFSMDLPDITDRWLKSAGDIKHVVIFGIESHVCVLQTTLDLLDRGIQVHVIKDGVSSCNVGEIDVALERMRDSGAKITTSESVLFQMLVDASHPKFKAISGLIKEEKQQIKDAVNTLGLAKY
ncbi:related to Isochorismatase domain-containing protein 2, mitochondrial [Ustilago bromivora]|uniref:Related to Isochorismatase domain-containing protein 2, mitochondrial n=1 Tax=Ustilago bromivora TaxID=307758 RepID=A0A1K0HDM0_9BASI|nr:related to Isochorismatase domain-containing protein 2, mitochondrial [Ustilago bromivora]SYW76624.1 related to Isochorismatase domain-containing protein 2, mitochondrial [Ustilago bromivora]